MVGVIGWFVPIMKELSEMTYQFDREYFFDSSKFNAAFNFKPTSNREAVRKTIEVLKKG
jgi:nucleoside-diphosphate-sugar epimerase